VGDLLNAYYQLEEKKEPVIPVNSSEDPDKNGFDVKRYFDSMVTSGQLPDLVKRSESLDGEIRSLDTDMQALVYRNYSKFIHATDVIKEMAVGIRTLDEDLEQLQTSCARMKDFQREVDARVTDNASTMKKELKQRDLVRSVKVLFDLPSTLQSCLDQGAYRGAVQAYSACAPFLRHHRHVPALEKVLQETETQMSLIRDSLQDRLASNVPLSEALACAVTLLDIGEKEESLAKLYLDGRVECVDRFLERCFDSDSALPDPSFLPVIPREPEAALPEPTAEEETDRAEDGGEATQPVEEKEEDVLERPESLLLQNVCGRLAQDYAPELLGAIEHFQELFSGKSAQLNTEQMLTEFVSRAMTALCNKIALLVQAKCPPTRVLVACILAVKDILQPINSTLPRQTTKIFTTFLNSIASKALVALFAEAASHLVSELLKLEGVCRDLQTARSSGLDAVLDEIAKTEQAIIMHGFQPLAECQPLLELCQDRFARSQLLRDLHSQLISFFLVFVEACYTYIGREATEAHHADPSLPILPRLATAEVNSLASTKWEGLFSLSLVRIGRHLEVKAMVKVWAVAKDLFTRGGGDSAVPASALQPNAAAIRAARAASQAMITHYVFMCGQTLAGLLRNAFEDKNWLTAREPKAPQLVVDFILKEAYACDCQLSRILGDPRKPPEVKRRALGRQVKNAMELEMERLWAKKLKVFAPVPFNRNGAIMGVLGIAFKALCELVRERTFAKYGFQQVQLDCAFLAEVMREFVEEEDAAVLDSLLDEAITSASQRCLEPIQMEDIIVQALCDEKKKTFRLE